MDCLWVIGQRQFAPVGLLVLLMAGCASSASIAHDAFVSKYSCPSAIATPLGTGAFDVTGCGYHATYACGQQVEARPDRYGRQYVGAVSDCEERQQISYEATDGSKRVAWFSDEVQSHFAVSKECAIASAARDLPCPSASIVVVGSDERGFASALEGCGQRATYHLEDIPTPPGRVAPAPFPLAHRYVLAGRVPISAAPAPGPSASIPSGV